MGTTGLRDETRKKRLEGKLKGLETTHILRSGRIEEEQLDTVTFGNSWQIWLGPVYRFEVGQNWSEIPPVG